MAIPAPPALTRLASRTSLVSTGTRGRERRPATLADTTFFKEDCPPPFRKAGASSITSTKEDDVGEFLNATEAFIGILDVISLSGFLVVKNDFQENIKMTRAALKKDPNIKSMEQAASNRNAAKGLVGILRELCFLCGALEELVGMDADSKAITTKDSKAAQADGKANSKDSVKTGSKPVAPKAATPKAKDSQADSKTNSKDPAKMDGKQVEPNAAFSAAYRKYLQRHHDLVETSLYSAAFDACPSRDAFMAAVGNDLSGLKSSLEALSKVLETMVPVFGDKFKWP